MTEGMCSAEEEKGIGNGCCKWEDTKTGCNADVPKCTGGGRKTKTHACTLHSALCFAKSSSTHEYIWHSESYVHVWFSGSKHALPAEHDQPQHKPASPSEIRAKPQDLDAYLELHGRINHDLLGFRISKSSFTARALVHGVWTSMLLEAA
jgi:hypothetical protein